MPETPISKPQTLISIIAAVAENGVIGREGGMPWHLPADLRYFKQTTMGHCLVMGRRTFESFGKPLPGRVTIVLTGSPEKVLQHENVRTAGSLEEAFALVPTTEMRQHEVFIAGGAGVYAAALPLAHRLYLTRIHATLGGDTFFPKHDPVEWKLVETEHHPADDKHAHALTFRVLDRVQS